MASTTLESWLHNQYQRRFYLAFAQAQTLTAPLGANELPLTAQQMKDQLVGFLPEYPVDAGGRAWRVSPIFRDVNAAVSWLTKAASTWRSPFPGNVDLYDSEYGSSDPNDGQIVFDLADRYGGHAYAQDTRSSPLSTVVFRGQADARHGLMPRLYHVFLNPKLGCWKARRRFKDEVEKTRRFTGEFFSNRETAAVLQNLRGPDLRIFGLPSRAAIARHYGYHSQFIDFTADVGVAGMFATSGAVNEGQIGSIWYLDEAHLHRRFLQLALIRTPRYEHRFLFHDSVERLRSVLKDEEAIGNLDWSGSGEPWEQAAKCRVVNPLSLNSKDSWVPPVVTAPVHFSISLYFAPGPTVPRMNAQAWCAIEVNTHLGWNKGKIKRSMAVHKLLERLAGRVNFVHRRFIYQRPSRKGSDVPPIYRQEISDAALFPKDLLTQAIEHYQETTGLVPA